MEEPRFTPTRVAKVTALPATVFLCLALLQYFTTPALNPGPASEFLKTCFDNQKGLSTAIAVYEIKSGAALTTTYPHRLSEEDLSKLVAVEALKEPLNDSVRIGAPRRGYYVVLSGKHDIVCLRHGQPNGQGSAREQLGALGVKDGELLAAASQAPPDTNPPIPEDWIWRCGLVIGLVAIVAIYAGLFL